MLFTSTLKYKTHSDADRDIIPDQVFFFLLRLLFGNEFDLDEIQKAFTSKVMKAKHPGAPSVAVSVAAGNT